MRPPDIRVDGGPRRWPRPDPLAVCEFCHRPTDDPTALCDRYECQLATVERDRVLAAAVGKELDE